MKKKLLLICQNFYPEMISTGLFMTELATSVNNNFDDIEIEVLCSYPSKKTFTDKEIINNYKNVHIIRKRSNGKEHGSVFGRLLFALSFFLRVLRYLVLHQKKYAGFIITTNPPFLGLATVPIKKFFKKPYFLIVHDVYPDLAVKMGILKQGSLTTKIWNSITVSILKNANRFSVIGRDMERIILAKAEGLKTKSVLIFNWSDANHVKPIAAEENLFLKQYSELKNKFLFVYSGNLGRTHNIEDILALAKVFETENDCVFLIIGGGAKFNKVKEEAGLLKNVMVLPYQSFELLPHVLSASAFCFVCLDKNFTGYSVPSKTYGIMAAGKPLIAFLAEDSEIGMAVKEAQCGFVINNNNGIYKLKQEILQAIQTGEHKKMGNNAFQSFKEHYTLEIASEKYYNAFKNTF
jgi:glycosyltransferase involved in cell wall biosynthesis